LGCIKTTYESAGKRVPRTY